MEPIVALNPKAEVFSGVLMIFNYDTDLRRCRAEADFCGKQAGRKWARSKEPDERRKVKVKGESGRRKRKVKAEGESEKQRQVLAQQALRR